ncbi:MAG: hypothetical protein P8M22_10400 [Phycisphaerales bacterium]|nr:hypothetical protein [Phycisphaerales bacterium]
MSESKEHRELKRWSSRWLREQGYVAVGVEVADSTGRFRVDVAGWSDREPANSGLVRAKPRAVLVECKRSRGDFLRDGVKASGLLARRAELIDALAVRGLSPARLFPSTAGGKGTLFEGISRDAQRPGQDIRRLRIELSSIERRLFRGVKFARLVRWRGANQMWLAAPEGMVSPAELPVGWGLLEVPSRILNGSVPEGIPALEVVRIRRAAPAHEVSEVILNRLLRNIAVANSRFVGGRRIQAKSRHDFANFLSTTKNSRAG